MGEQVAIYQIKEERQAFHMSPKTQQMIEKPANSGLSLIRNCSCLVHCAEESSSYSNLLKDYILIQIHNILYCSSTDEVHGNGDDGGAGGQSGQPSVGPGHVEVRVL